MMRIINVIKIYNDSILNENVKLQDCDESCPNFNKIMNDNFRGCDKCTAEPKDMQILRHNSIVARKHVYTYIRLLSYMATIAMFWVTFFLAAPHIEEQLFPAFGQMNVVQVQHEATDRLEFIITGPVLRSCKYIRIGAMVKVDGIWQSGHVKTPDIPPDFMIPKGVQTFGRLRIYPKGDETRVIVENQCHPLWINHTTYWWPDETGKK